MFRRKIFVIVGIGLFLAVAVSITGAASDQAKDTPQKPAAAAVQPPAAPQAGAPGMRVFIDPATGKLREPEQSDIQQLAPAVGFHALQAPAAPLQGPGGAVGMRLDDSQMVYSVATKNPDGSISFECVTGPANASKALAGKHSERSQSDVK